MIIFLFSRTRRYYFIWRLKKYASKPCALYAYSEFFSCVIFSDNVNMAESKISAKDKVKECTFKKWAFAGDFNTKVENGVVVAALCKFCSAVEYNKYFCEIKRRGFKGQVLKSMLSYRKEVTYIHHKTLARHVGDANSIHNWCKKNIVGAVKETQDEPTQKRVDEMVISNSFEYHQKLFTTVLTIVEEELAFLKLKPLMELQVKNGLKLGSTDKINDMSCAEMVDVLADTVSDAIKNFMNAAHFLTLSADGSESRKTSEEKELVYGKVVACGDFGVIPTTFLLKCQSLKEFGGADGEGTFKAMLDATNTYVSEDDLKKMLVCITTDGAAVNFGAEKGAISRMFKLIGWEALRIHCFNHSLELAIKDSYNQESTFDKIKTTLTTLFYLFKNSGKSWRMFRLAGEQLGLQVLRYTKVHGTRFQAHMHQGLSNFLRNLLCFLLFCENVEEAGSGKDAIVTKKMYPKIVGFRKEWSNYKTIATANLYFQVLCETSRLCLTMESNSVLIYDVLEAVRSVQTNLKELSEDESVEELPANIKVIKDNREKDVINVKVRN